MQMQHLNLKLILIFRLIVMKPVISHIAKRLQVYGIIFIHCGLLLFGVVTVAERGKNENPPLRAELLCILPSLSFTNNS